MTINVGTPDRILRLILGLLLIAAPFITGWALFANPVWLWASVIVGVVLALTGIIRFCPGYTLLNISTVRKTQG